MCAACDRLAEDLQTSHFYDEDGYIVEPDDPDGVWMHDWCAPPLSDETMREYREDEE